MTDEAGNDHAVTYTAQDGDTASAVRSGLIGAIGADPDFSAVVSAEGQGNDATFSAVMDSDIDPQTVITPGGTVTPSTATANVKQVSQITVSGTIEAGDGYTVTIDDSYSVTYTVVTGDSIADIRDGLKASLEGDADITAIVDESAGMEPGQIILTAKSAGTVIKVEGSTQNTTSLASTDDNDAFIAHKLSGDDTADIRIDGEAGDDLAIGSLAGDKLVGGRVMTRLRVLPVMISSRGMRVPTSLRAAVAMILLTAVPAMT